MIDATKDGYACWQTQNPLFGHPLFTLMSEDCLVLSVWTPDIKPRSLMPVMFFIHGGNLMTGTSFNDMSNGKVLATHDVVIVVINYRLGRLGFLYGGDDSAPGNAGLYDQLLALHWVSVPMFPQNNRI